MVKINAIADVEVVKLGRGSAPHVVQFSGGEYGTVAQHHMWFPLWDTQSAVKAGDIFPVKVLKNSKTGLFEVSHLHAKLQLLQNKLLLDRDQLFAGTGDLPYTLIRGSLVCKKQNRDLYHEANNARWGFDGPWDKPQSRFDSTIWLRLDNLHGEADACGDPRVHPALGFEGYLRLNKMPGTTQEKHRWFLNVQRGIPVDVYVIAASVQRRVVGKFEIPVVTIKLSAIDPRSIPCPEDEFGWRTPFVNN